MPKIERALVSVSDKSDVVWFARELVGMGIDIVSTGGTYRMLKQEGVNVTLVSDVTDFPEMLDGRVKTLHPKIHGGILADRSKPEHLRQLEFQKIPKIDLVAVNLYPFAKTVAQPDVKREDAIEQIDIGGPTMVRAAAKNQDHVAVVVNPDMYKKIIEEMKRTGGEVSVETCRKLALEAFRHTAEYDAMISDYLAGSGADASPEKLVMSFEKVTDLRYGENPHQAASLYASDVPVPGSLAHAPQLSGPAVSFNNVLDGEAAWSTVLEFEEPACVIIKHNNPCGVAASGKMAEAYRLARESDPISAYGSVIAVNRVLDKETAEAMKSNFIELLLAPGYEEDALEILRAKEVRVLEMGEIIGSATTGKDFRRVRGGLLLQDFDYDPYDRSTMKVITSVSPTEEQWEDLLFAWKVCKHVKSNAIVLVKGGATIGVGAGQMSRVDSAMIAVEKAGDRADGCVVASDAFFPFPDAVEKVVEAGAKAIIQPGGSKNDDKAIEVCEKNGIAMVLTGRRHFRH